MSKEELETINVGIVGHIDHGKTTILYKLSGKWADTHSEEMKRGITLKLGYADITISKDKDQYNKDGKGVPVLHVSFVDNPGHEMLMATMLSGAAMIDTAILVIAANEGIKPQTREHLIALKAKNVKNLIVVQNKIDLIPKEKTIENYKEIKALLKGRFDDAPIIPISAQQEVNIDKIYQAIAELPIPPRDKTGNPLFLIARSFDINRPGTSPKDLHGAVLGGTLKRGSLKVGDEIEIKPGRVIKEANQYHYKTMNTKVVRLFKGSKEVQELTPGGSMSIETGLDMALGKGDAFAGCIASISKTLPEITNSVRVSFSLFNESFTSSGTVKIDPLKPSETILLSINTSKTLAIVKKMNKNEAELVLKTPIVPFKGDTVAIARNFNTHWRLIGSGNIV
ncbi:translation initiation factor IF-2 subunit gamma [Candidatus Pacearchaeota archaeon]|nr:translation initiation factor IF-2 subunit gamma [Candidatus Pacearchaeota archaeon]